MASWEQLVEYGRQLGPDPELAGIGTDDLERDVRSQAVALAAARARWIVLVTELVVRGVWADQGARTPGAWLSWAVGMAPSTARDHVRVGLALRGLPRIRAAFLAGRVSWSKVRAVTRLADERTEDVLLAWMDAAPAAELERIVGATRRSCRIDGVEADPWVAVDPTDASAEAARVERFGWHQADDAVVLTIRMDEADGARAVANLRWLARQQDASMPSSARVVAALDQALAAAMDAAPDDASGLDRDRLVVDATLVGAEDGDGDVRVSREPATDSAESPDTARQLRLVPRPGPGGLPSMTARTLRRLACTAGIVPVVVDPDGTPLDVGREQRRATAKQRKGPACP